MLYVYLAFALLLLCFSVLAGHFVRRWGPLRGGAGALLTLVLLVACWPIPIHGGFMLLGEVFLSELQSMRKQHGEKRDLRRHDAFIASQAARFAGRLDFAPDARAEPGWRLGRGAAGDPLWLDQRSGLVWSDLLPLARAEPEDLLEEARSTCAAQPPRGHWALPSDAEGYTLWRNGGERVLPQRPGRIVSARIDTEFELAIPIVRVVRGSAAATRAPNQPPGAALPWLARCVALGPQAPARGYLDLDIARDDWNAYQLSKLNPRAR